MERDDVDAKTGCSMAHIASAREMMTGTGREAQKDVTIRENVHTLHT